MDTGAPSPLPVLISNRPLCIGHSITPSCAAGHRQDRRIGECKLRRLRSTCHRRCRRQSLLLRFQRILRHLLLCRLLLRHLSIFWSRLVSGYGSDFTRFRWKCWGSFLTPTYAVDHWDLIMRQKQDAFTGTSAWVAADSNAWRTWGKSIVSPRDSRHSSKPQRLQTLPGCWHALSVASRPRSAR